MKTQLNMTDTRVLGSPSPTHAPWAEFPFPAYWVDHFPSSSSSLPEFMAVVYDEDQSALWLEAISDLDDALTKALERTKAEGAAHAVVYRYAIAPGALDANSPSEYSVLIDGYYDLSAAGFAHWVSAVEIADTPPTII